MFDEKGAKTEIVGTIISQIMRLNFRTEDGAQGLSLLMDRHDIEELRVQCEQALNKADLIESRLAHSELRTLHVGEDLDELR